MGPQREIVFSGNSHASAYANYQYLLIFAEQMVYVIHDTLKLYEYNLEKSLKNVYSFLPFKSST